MTTREQILLVAACAFASTAYMTPTFVAIACHADRPWRTVVINALLGWTLIGWIVALRLASRPPSLESLTSDWSPWTPGRPEAARPTAASRSTYLDGTYLVSQDGDARTWAVCSDGRWGIAYELGGVQRTAAWVDASDVPVHVLAHALAPYPEPRA